jgi:phosphoribosylformylglycinamidine synthase subunit PurQ / glutaminase
MKTAPSALVLRTAGTNCDRETMQALEWAGARPALVHVQRLFEEPARLDGASILVIPGGFSYGDDVAAGRILGYQLREQLAQPLAVFVARGGLVLGVCNGFQVLVDTGLLEEPASAGAAPQRQLALASNASNRFECRWITLRSERSACPWLVPGEIWPAPVAHGEGRFLARDPGALERLRERGQIALRYVRPMGHDRGHDGADGGTADGYPANPNGSVEDIAGICDRTGRVLGLMPHPERNLTPWHHPQWTRMPPRAEGEGLRFYRRMVALAEQAPARATVRD